MVRMPTNLDLIETERLVLSGWRPEELPDLMRLQGDPVVARYSSVGRPWTEADAKAALAEWMELFATRRLGKLRVRRKADGVLVGRAGFGLYAPTGAPEIGYALYPEFWGNGYAFESAAGLRDWFFRETPGDRFVGMAHVTNTASLAILTGIGMTKTHVAPYGRLQEPFQFHVHDGAGTMREGIPDGGDRARTAG